MPQEIITFEKGLMPQLGQTIKMPGTYLEALNMIRDEMGNLSNEPGTSAVYELTSGYKIVGMYQLNDDIIIASTNGTMSNIGILNNNDEYKGYISNTILGFQLDQKVRIEGRLNYKGERIIYLAGKGIKLRSINLDSIPGQADFDKVTALFLEYLLPQVKLSSIGTGGAVKSGVYQFAARLVTESNNTTSFGPISNVIPIGVGNPTGNRKDYQGGEPQTPTSNSITLTVDNIDTSFKYIELVVVTYIGEGNVVSVKSLGKIDTRNRESINITYAGDRSEVGTLLEEELEIDITNYSSGNYILQKDNTLLISGLEEEEDDFDWQKIANSIKLQYVELLKDATENINIVNANGTSFNDLSFETKTSGAGFGPWTDVGIGGSNEDYKNAETAAKFVGYKRNEVYSFTFTPIFKSGRKGNAYHISGYNPSPGPTDLLPAPVNSSGVTYGVEFGTPLQGKPVTYHRMPDNMVSPFTKTVSGKEYINILGIKSTITASDSLGWKDKIIGYIIGREDREGKETILAQGILKRLYRTGGSTDIYSIIPSTGKMGIWGTDKADLPAPGDQISSSYLHPTIFTFYSPDLIIKNTDYTPTQLRLLGHMSMKYEYASTGERERAKFNAGNLVSCKVTSFLNTVVNLTGQKTNIQSESVDSLDRIAYPDNASAKINTLLGKVRLYSRRTIKCVALESTSTIPMVSMAWHDQFIDKSKSKNGIYLVSTESQSGLELYELYTNNDLLYGDVYNKTSYPVSTVLFSKGSKSPITGENLTNSTSIFFGGDTFISRYAMTLKDTAPYFGSVEDLQVVPKTSSTVYFMLESPHNYNYRHYIENGDDEQGTTPYYPKYRILQNGENGINDFPVSLGHSEGYNKQYSVSNKFQRTFTKAIGEENISKFDNRIMYSATSIEGERFDAFRLFLPANYHDIPKQYGIITGMFAQGSELYVHTQRSLWRSFYNTLATQATSEGDIVLGNGGAFNRPSVPIITTEGGYAGCLDIDASIGTPMGRYFYDANNSKFYTLGEGLIEISNPAIYQKLRELVHKQSVILGYDKGLKRVILSSPNLTLSYKPELNSFESYHSYKFDFLMSRDLTDYIIQGGRIHKFDDTITGRYFNTVYNSKIKFHSVDNPFISKRYTSIVTISNASKPDTKLHLPFEFFDKFQAYSLEKHTGLNNLRVIKEYEEDLETLGNVFVHKANNKFRLAVPPNVVYDVAKSNQATDNWVTYGGFSDEDRVFLPDMIDNHMVFEFIIDNTVQRIIKVNAFIINFEQNIT